MKKYPSTMIALLSLIFTTLFSLSILSGLSSCNHKDREESLPVKDGSEISIIPNDGKDDTHSIQMAIDAAERRGGGTVVLADGDYNVNADTTIFIKSNVTLQMSENARLLVAPNNKQRYYVIRMVKVKNAKIYGGQIIGDRDQHLGTGGEWGYGISISGSNDVLVEGTRVYNCWGDGLGVGGYMGTPSKNVTLKHIISDNNRRQGMSIFDVTGLFIDSCQFSNTNGTKPMDGIDIEPDAGTAENISITNCRIFGNVANGIEINAKASTSAVIKNITIQKNEIYGDAYSGYLVNGSNINFTNNWLYSNKYLGNRVYNKNCQNSFFDPNIYHQKQ